MALPEQHPLRKVAVLVASLDDPWASRVLDELPASTAQAVAEAALDLGPLDPDEQRNVVKEFRRSMAHELLPRNAPTAQPSAPTATTHGVELDASLLARLDSQEFDADTSGSTDSHTESLPQTACRLPNAIGQADPNMLADLLAEEHPQTIAVVLSRFSEDRAGAILVRLSNRLQAEVLSRMADLDMADPQTLHVVESQLAQWIDQQQQQKRRIAVGADLVQRILSSAPQAHRDSILTTISHLKPELSRRLQGAAQPSSSPSAQPLNLQENLRPVAAPKVDNPTITAVATCSHTKSPAPSENPRSDFSADYDPKMTSASVMTELERADDATLLAALSQADRRVSMLALAGASESLLKRILQGMPRRQAKQFRKQLCTIPPTRLSEILAAQQHLAQLVREV
ncbi:MAG: hypothetical protein MK171_09675 [Pirellulales bacterium]|nr:hypothetical protein [Pirellulales bacterium]